MLILTPHVDQSIIIGDNIVIKILSNTAGQVRIGIEAPKNIPVHRDEIYRKIQKSKQEVVGNNEGMKE